MNAYFDSTQIKRVDIEGNAKTIYFLEDEEENDTVIVVNRKGMNRIYAANISLGVIDGDIETATYRESPDGMLYPMKDIKKDEERVEQFKWSDNKHPVSCQDMIEIEDEKKNILTIFKIV